MKFFKFSVIVLLLSSLSNQSYSSSLLEKSLHHVNDNASSLPLSDPILSSEASVQKEFYIQGALRKIDDIAQRKMHSAFKQYANRTTQFKLVIGQLGQIKQLDVIQSSGVQVFDHLVLRAVVVAAPFPTFPLVLAKETQTIEITRHLRYNSNK